MSTEDGSQVAARVVTRRSAVLAVLAGTAAAGCTPYTVDRPAVSLPTPTGPRGTDPDVLLAGRVLEQQRSVVALLEATVRRHPALAIPVERARAVHAAHIGLLEEAVPDNAEASPDGTPTSEPSRRPDGPVVRGRARAAAQAAARAEDRLALLAKRSAFAAQSGGFARILASMAAAATQQAILLRAPEPTEPAR